jgi:hypothetical protein
MFAALSISQVGFYQSINPNRWILRKVHSPGFDTGAVGAFPPLWPCGTLPLAAASGRFVLSSDVLLGGGPVPTSSAVHLGGGPMPTSSVVLLFS